MVPLVLEDGRWLQRYEQTAFPFSDEESEPLVLIASAVASTTATSIPSTYRSTWGARRDPLYIVIPVTIIYALIFLTGVIGNVSTCIVIARNKSMHTATNYYLFSLAVSDLLLLVSGLPPEMYYIWSHFPYIFGEVFCVIQGFAAETSANATVLTITAFTIERYVAICHPFLSHTMSKLTRAIKFVVAIWLVALCLAIPQAMSVGIVYEMVDGRIPYEDHYVCLVKRVVIPHAFEISTFVFFVAPMTLITVLYVLIGLQLRRSSIIARGGAAGSSVSLRTRGSMFKRKKRTSTEVVAVIQPDSYQGQVIDPQSDDGRKNYSKNMQNKATKHVVKMLVAVVVAFFICWAPFHAQRLLAVYGTNNAPHMVAVFNVLTYVSGILYYLSTTINPLLYHIMSNKFREAFKDTLARCCGRGRLARRRAAGAGVGAPGGVGRCYSILSGRFSQNNSTSGGSGAGYFGIDDDGGTGSLRYNMETDVTSLREFRRPLVVSFRRRQVVTSPQERAAVASDDLENELREALANLADEGKSRYQNHRPTHLKSRRIDVNRGTRNNISLHVVSRESPHLDNHTVVLTESTVQRSTEFNGQMMDRRRMSRLEPASPDLRGVRVVSSTERFAKVEDIEIFPEQRFVMRDLKRQSKAFNGDADFCDSQSQTQSFDSDRFLYTGTENSRNLEEPESITSP